jgi:Domain of unknown function (DUF4410)
MKISRILVLAGVMCLTLSACASRPATVPARFPAYSRLVISSPDVDTAIISNLGEEDRKTFEEIKPKLVKAYLESVQERISRCNLFKEVVVDSGDLSGALVLRSEFTKINAGNKGLMFTMTYIVGLPIAGKPRIEMKAKLVDGQTGHVIDSKTREKDTGWKMTDFQDLFLDFTREIGEEFADFVEDYMRSPIEEG